MPRRYQPISLEDMCIRNIAGKVLDRCVLLSQLITDISKRLDKTPGCSTSEVSTEVALNKNHVVQNLVVAEAEGSWGLCLPTPPELLSILQSDGEMKEACIMYLEIQKYVAMIAPHFANQYTVTLLKEASEKEDLDWGTLTLRAGFHPLCRTLTLAAKSYETEDVVQQVINNLQTMKELQCVDISICAQSNLTKKLVKSLQFHKNLRRLCIPSFVITDDHNLFSVLHQFCPHLQEIHFIWSLSQNQAGLLASLPHLSNVNVTCRDLMSTDIVHLLNTVPQLQEICFADELLDDVLLLCNRRYTVKKIDACLTNSQLMDRLVEHFPMLEYLSVEMPGILLTQLNQLSHLKTFISKGATPEQIASLGSTLYGLTEVYLEDVIDTDVTLNPLFFRLPTVSVLTLDKCLDVDLENVWKVFPYLTRLEVIECTFTVSYPNPQMTDMPYRYLQHLDICDYEENFESVHLKYLMSSCFDLRTLTLDLGYCLNDATFHEVLKNNEMTGLKEMILTSPGFTLGVLPIVTEYIGDELELLHIEFMELGEDQALIAQKFQEYSGRYGKLEILLHLFEEDWDEDM